jgi:glycerol-3-phosphate dehydrogenase
MAINATGAWASSLPQAPAGAPKLRPLRGSHFVFPRDRLPIQHAVSWLHPKDARPIFAYPWQGAVVYGTTDLDHGDDRFDVARMTPVESAYLIDGLAYQFPELGLRASDAVATYAGVRPVVAGDRAVDPSAESRESAMWSSPGMVSITGGKLTTFRITARQVLAEASKQFPRLKPGPALPVFSSASENRDAQTSLTGTPYTWEGIRASARDEKVVHLADLMLRRTRLGLVARDGGAAFLERIGAICREELGWDDGKWMREERDYRALWQAQHAPVIA